MVYRYAQIPFPKAVELGLEKTRKRTATGAVIINESDLLTYGKGSDFQKKVKQLGGTVLTALEAKKVLEQTVNEL